MGSYSEMLLYAPKIPKIIGKGGFGILLDLVFLQLLNYLLILVGYLAKNKSIFKNRIESINKQRRKNIIFLMSCISKVPFTLPTLLTEYIHQEI